MNAKFWKLVKATATNWIEDDASSMGAAIAYYTLFSIAPILIIVLAVPDLILGSNVARWQFINQMREWVGNSGAEAIQGLLEGSNTHTRSTSASVVGVVLMLFGMTSVFVELQSALDRIWRAPPVNDGWFREVFMSRILSLAMIFCTGLLVLISLCLSVGIAALGTWWTPVITPWRPFLEAINFMLGFLVIAVAFSAIYKVLPRVSVKWHDVWVGGAVTALLFTVGKYIVGEFLGRATIVSQYGAAAALMGLLIWVYYSAQIFLLGAEFTCVYAHRHDSRDRRPPSG